MKKLIIIFVLALGVMSCDKQDSTFIEKCDAFKIYVDDGVRLRVLHLKADNAIINYSDFKVSVKYHEYSFVMQNVDDEIVIGECLKDNRWIDFNLMKVELFNLYYAKN